MLSYPSFQQAKSPSTVVSIPLKWVLQSVTIYPQLRGDILTYLVSRHFINMVGLQALVGSSLTPHQIHLAQCHQRDAILVEI